ncbi:MAG: TPM domain-containing protein [Gammaproteobacteria bacterium]
MVRIKRWLVHAFLPPWRWRLAFPDTLLKEIESAIKASERQHRGEIRFAVENTLAFSSLWRGLTARQRALEIFSDLRVWDTEENCGILIYLLLADHEVHIIADRGIARRVDPSDWNRVAEAMQSAFGRGEFRCGSLAGIERVTRLLADHFPSDGKNPNELEDHPVVIER